MLLDDGYLGNGMFKTIELDKYILRSGSSIIKCRKFWQKTTRIIDTRSTKHVKESCMHTISSVFLFLS